MKICEVKMPEPYDPEDLLWPNVPPDPDSSLLALKNEWASIARDTQHELDKVREELAKEKRSRYAAERALDLVRKALDPDDMDCPICDSR